MTKPDLAKRLSAYAVKIQKKIPEFEDQTSFSNSELSRNMNWANQMMSEREELGEEAFRHTGRSELVDWLQNSSLWLSFIRTYGEMNRAKFCGAQEMRKTVRGIKSSIPEDWLGIETMTIYDAAARLDLTTSHVYKLISKGKIATLEGTNLPLKTSVESYAQISQPKKKRPKGTPKDKAKQNNRAFLKRLNGAE